LKFSASKNSYIRRVETRPSSLVQVLPVLQGSRFIQIRLWGDICKNNMGVNTEPLTQFQANSGQAQGCSHQSSNSLSLKTEVDSFFVRNFHAALALLYRPSEPITLHTLQVESMQFCQVSNVVGAVLYRFCVHRPGGEDMSGHEGFQTFRVRFRSFAVQLDWRWTMPLD
jgi:hypothetical protein